MPPINATSDKKARRGALIGKRLIVPAIALILGAASCSERKDAIVGIDPSRTFQTMDSWEATAKMWEFDKRANRFDGSWIPIRDKILTALVEEGGINRLRLEMRSGMENPVDYWSQFQAGRLSYTGLKAHFYEKINDNNNPWVLNPKGIQFSELDFRVENIILPAMRIARRLGRPMTFSLCYVDFRWTKLKGTLSHADNPEEYAELVAATYAHLKEKYGLVPAALEIILEPDNSDGWHGKQVGEAIVAVTRRLAKQGVNDPRIIAPSTSVARKTLPYFDELSAVPGAARHVTTLSYHRYGGHVSDDLLAQIVGRARKHGAQTAMLEYTHARIDDLFADLTKADVSSWQKYSISMVAGRGGNAPGNMLIVTDPNPDHTRMQLLHSSTAMAHIFRGVDRGAVRIGSPSSQPWTKAVAFRNPDNRMTVAIMAKNSLLQSILVELHDRLDTPLPKPGQGKWVRVKGLNAGPYLMQRFNSLDLTNMRCLIDVKRGDKPPLYLRGADVVTLVQQRADEMPRAPVCPQRVAEQWQ